MYEQEISVEEQEVLLEACKFVKGKLEESGGTKLGAYHGLCELESVLTASIEVGSTKVYMNNKAFAAALTILTMGGPDNG